MGRNALTSDYYDALDKCYLRYLDMAKGTDLEEFVLLFGQGICDELPLMKLNRWLGYIQGNLIAKSLTTVETERDWTRPLFRPLDFGDY